MSPSIIFPASLVIEETHHSPFFSQCCPQAPIHHFSENGAWAGGGALYCIGAGAGAGAISPG